MMSRFSAYTSILYTYIISTYISQMRYANSAVDKRGDVNEPRTETTKCTADVETLVYNYGWRDSRGDRYIFYQMT